jgi:DNA polymerase
MIQGTEMRDEGLKEDIKHYFSYLKDLGEDELYIDIDEEKPDSGDCTQRVLVSEAMDQLREEAELCRGCKLCESRTNLVFGVGDPGANLMLIGEAPGRDEDLKGEPFVGAAGQLLDRILKAMDLRREEVYIANLLKCRPPQNRDPDHEEIEACIPFLESQITIIRPRVICTLGSFAARALLGSHSTLGGLRGRIHAFRGIDLVPTYHPAALLRHPAWKRPTWEDMKKVMELLGRSGEK